MKTLPGWLLAVNKIKRSTSFTWILILSSLDWASRLQERPQVAHKTAWHKWTRSRGLGGKIGERGWAKQGEDQSPAWENVDKETLRENIW